MLCLTPEDRPPAEGVLEHPWFGNSGTYLEDMARSFSLKSLSNSDGPYITKRLSIKVDFFQLSKPALKSPPLKKVSLIYSDVINAKKIIKKGSNGESDHSDEKKRKNGFSKVMAERLVRMGLKKTSPHVRNNLEEVKLVDSETFEKFSTSECDKQSPAQPFSMKVLPDVSESTTPKLKEFGSGKKVPERKKSRFSTCGFALLRAEEERGAPLQLVNMHTILTVKSINEESKIEEASMKVLHLGTSKK